MGDIALAAFLVGPPVGGILVGVATLGRFPLALGAVTLLMVCIGVVASLSGKEDAEGSVLLLVITLPSAAAGVVVGHLGAWLARRITTV